METETEKTEKTENRGRKAELAHEKFMKAKGIEPADLPEELQKADVILKEAKKEDFEAANEASQLLVEALQESIYEINETIEKIGETLTDHEERINEIENLMENTPENPENEPIVVEDPALPAEIAYSSKEEEILAKLHSEGVGYITKPELKELGFNIGFFSKLTARGATYGDYQLIKAPSEKVYQLVKIA